MKIERVEYRRLITTVGYSNETVGATAIVDNGEDASVVMHDLRKWVGRELGCDDGTASLRQEVNDLRAQKTRLESALPELRSRYQAGLRALRDVKEVAEDVDRLSIRIDDLDDDDIPF